MTISFKYGTIMQLVILNLVLNSELDYSNTHKVHLPPIILYFIERTYIV